MTEAADHRVAVDVSDSELDGELGVYTLFFAVPRYEIVFFKLVIESYEGLASGRSMNRRPQDEESEQVLEVVLAVPDLIEDTRRMLSWLASATAAEQVASTPELREELRNALRE
ncbi:MAG TPA: hypothetical protein VEL28_11610 [Candidatus Binatia bacterium]|nr:hypothetical protein [Candidatus Binatia bacterium]